MSMNNIQADQIWTTPLNELDVVQKGFDRSRPFVFTTPRFATASSRPAFCFSAKDKLEIACKLAELGVGRIESGFPRVSEEDTEAVSASSRQI